jgi:hypothetical protein
MVKAAAEIAVAVNSLRERWCLLFLSMNRLLTDSDTESMHDKLGHLQSSREM